MIKNLVSTVPLGRVGKPTECATAIAFLASDAAVIGENCNGPCAISVFFSPAAPSRGLNTSIYGESFRRDSTVDEVLRNFFIRQPVLWLE